MGKRMNQERIWGSAGRRTLRSSVYDDLVFPFALFATIPFLFSGWCNNLDRLPRAALLLLRYATGPLKTGHVMYPEKIYQTSWRR